MIDLKLTNVSDNIWFGRSQMDITYDGLGNPDLVQGYQYFNQMVQKDILTAKKDTNLYPQYGSNVRDVLGDAVEDTITRSFIMNTITQALQRIVYNQQNLLNTYNFDATELLDSIQNIMIRQNDKVKTQYDITLYLNTKAGQQAVTVTV